MTPEFWITSAAIVIGPLAAVLISKYLQDRSDKRQRQMQVYRSLMATRRMPLSPQRVEALNLVDVEFIKSKKVMLAFKDLIAVYNDSARWKSTDATVQSLVRQDVDDKTADLLMQMGKTLGFTYGSLDILRGGYHPEAFDYAQRQHREALDFVVSLHRGERAVPVILVPLPSENVDEK